MCRILWMTSITIQHKSASLLMAWSDDERWGEKDENRACLYAVSPCNVLHMYGCECVLCMCWAVGIFQSQAFVSIRWDGQAWKFNRSTKDVWGGRGNAGARAHFCEWCTAGGSGPSFWPVTNCQHTSHWGDSGALILPCLPACIHTHTYAHP